MQVQICDRCGHRDDKFEGRTEFHINGENRLSKRVDLCKSCENAVIEFIQTKVKT